MLKSLLQDFKTFLYELVLFLVNSLHQVVARFESAKSVVATSLYRQRGKMAKRLMHSGMAGITALGVMIAPIIAQELPDSGVDPWEAPSPSMVLSASTESEPQTDTVIGDREFRDKIIEYKVEEADTVSSIAQKFGVSVDTVLWENDLSEREAIKVGQILRVLPLTGLSHKVKKGDTVYSIAKKYDVDAQAVVNYPFNTFVNDETFELAIGQSLIVPEGVQPSATPSAPRIRRITPDAGTVVASGAFIWPTSGRITQNFVWYHQGLDIANKAAPAVLAADAGRVLVAGWLDNYGYGNRIVIDHGNGMRTLYAHLSRIYVTPGQSVNRGDTIGQMGSTGRSTGTHLHFEVIQNGVNTNPLSVLR